MARQIISTGIVANDGTGDDLYTGATKINANFLELYSTLTAISLSISSASTNTNGIGFGFDGILFDGATKDSFTTATRLVPEDPTQTNIITLRDSTGTLAFTDDITRIVNESYILGIKASGGTLLDSAAAIATMYAAGFLDSNLSVRLSLDSAEVTSYINATYIQSRQLHYLDSARALLFLVDQTAVDSSIDSSLVRIDSDIADLQAFLGNTITDTVPEGSVNLYYTTARHDSDTVVQVNKAFVDALGVDADTLDGVQYATIDNAINALPDSAEVAGIIADEMAAISYDLLPDLDSTRSLGSPTKKWKDLHISGSTIYLGGGTVSFDGASYNFGGGYPLSPDTIALDSAQRMFFGQYANIVNYQGGHGQGLYLNGNKIEHRTVDDASTGYFHTTNQQIVRLGDAGIVTLPHNTSNTRTSYSTNPFFTDWKIGSMHYNTDLGQFEMHDGTGWFAIDRTAAAGGGSGGSTNYIQYGYDATLSNPTGVSLFSTNGSSPPNGPAMPVAGSATHITASFNIPSHGTGSLTIWLELYKNGSGTGQIVQREISIEGNYDMTGTISHAYAAGDNLQLRLWVDTGNGGMSVVNMSAILRIVES